MGHQAQISTVLSKKLQNQSEVQVLQTMCFFFIYATKFDTKDKDDNSFQLRSFNLKHKYGKVHKNFHLTSKLIVQRYLEEFRGDPTWSLDGIVKKDMKLKISKMKA